MPFPDHLLEQARHLAHREKTRPRQASLRRSVSTAYYALFHLLISEATFNWKRADQRPLLARFFEHGKMRTSESKESNATGTSTRSRRPLQASNSIACVTCKWWQRHSFRPSRNARLQITTIRQPGHAPRRTHWLNGW